MDYKKEIEKLDTEIKKQQENKIRLEERYNSLTKEEVKINEELLILNIKPEELDSKIETLEKEIKSEIEKCQKILQN